MVLQRMVGHDGIIGSYQGVIQRTVEVIGNICVLSEIQPSICALIPVLEKSISDSLVIVMLKSFEWDIFSSFFEEFVVHLDQ